MQHTVCQKRRAVAAHDLADQKEIRLERIAERAQAADKIAIQGIGNVQTQAVNVKLFYPAANAVKNVLDDFFVAQIQLHQFIMTFPAFVPKSIVVIGVSVKADVEPIFVRRIPLFFLYILECPEAAADMVEHAVQHNAHAFFVQLAADFGKIFVGAEAAVDFSEISGIIAVAVRFKNRGKVHGVAADRRNVRRPIADFFDAVHGFSVVFPRCAAKTHWIDLIKNTLISPHNSRTSLLWKMYFL